MKKLLLLLLILSAGQMFAQFKIGGDFRVRPRYDIKDYGEFGDANGNKTVDDFYYMYRARLNLTFDIGDGWAFNTQLGHYGYGGYGFTNGLSTEPALAGAIEGTRRPSISFLRLYYGKQTEDWGVIGGIIPVSGFTNPFYDVHFYADKMVDVPYFIYSFDAAFGFNGYVKLGTGKLNLTLLADNNVVGTEDMNGDEIDPNDQYTLAVDYSLPVSDFTLQPMLIATKAEDGDNAPITYGLNLATPKFGKFSFSGSFIMSEQSNDATLEYSVQYFRIKTNAAFTKELSLLAWVDIAKRTDKFAAGDVEHDFTYIWAMLNWTVYKSDLGKVEIAPTVRIATEKIDNAMDFQRSRIEISTTISF